MKEKIALHKSIDKNSSFLSEVHHIKFFRVSPSLWTKIVLDMAGSASPYILCPIDYSTEKELEDIKQKAQQHGVDYDELRGAYVRAPFEASPAPFLSSNFTSMNRRYCFSAPPPLPMILPTSAKKLYKKP
jgi:hypothetical protein